MKRFISQPPTSMNKPSAIAKRIKPPSTPAKNALAALDECDEGLARADTILAGHLKGRKGDAVAEAVIGYYRDVYRAERKAMARVKTMLTARN